MSEPIDTSAETIAKRVKLLREDYAADGAGVDADLLEALAAELEEARRALDAATTAARKYYLQAGTQLDQIVSLRAELAEAKSRINQLIVELDQSDPRKALDEATTALIERTRERDAARAELAEAKRERDESREWVEAYRASDDNVTERLKIKLAAALASRDEAVEHARRRYDQMHSEYNAAKIRFDDLIEARDAQLAAAKAERDDLIAAGEQVIRASASGIFYAEREANLLLRAAIAKARGAAAPTDERGGG